MTSFMERIKSWLGWLDAAMTGQYHRRPGCCASGGLAATELEGRHRGKDAGPPPRARS